MMMTMMMEMMMIMMMMVVVVMMMFIIMMQYEVDQNYHDCAVSHEDYVADDLDRDDLIRIMIMMR